MPNIQPSDLSAGLATFPTFYMISGSWWLALIIAAFGVAMSVIANDWKVTIFGPMISTTILAIPVFFGLEVVGGAGLQTSLVVLIVLGIWVLVAKMWANSLSSGRREESHWLVLAAVPLMMHAVTRDWGQASTLTVVQSVGEDNGFFLDIAARTSDTGLMQPQSSSLSGGVIITGFVALGSGLRRLSSDEQVTTAIGVAETMQRLYYGLIYLAVLTGGSIVLSMRLRRRLFLDAAALVVTGGMVVAFSSGLIRAGHFSSLVAGVLILAIMLAFSGLEFSRQPGRAATVLVFLVLFLWQAWAPLATVGVGLIAALGVHYLPFLARSMNKSRRLTLFVVVVAVGILTFLLSPVVWRASWERTSNLLLETGGEARVIGWFAVLVHLAALLSASVRGDSAAAIRNAVLSSLSVSASLIMVAGWLLPPFEPQYGPNKYLYLITFSLTPIAIGFVRRSLENQSGLVGATLLVVMVSGIAQAASSPLSELALRRSGAVPAEWERGALVALNSFPERNVLCMETREDVDREYEAYRCSRLLNGMQGQLVDNNFFLWNLCQVPSRNIAALPNTVWQNTTILISDAGRLSTTDGCQSRGWSGDGLPIDDSYLLGWASGIRWDLVKIVSYDGNLVKPSFSYLGKYPQYTHDDIASLTAHLDE